MGTLGRVGVYDLESELGRGGMGRVYRARHVPTGAVRAVKVLPGGADPESVARFRREAETLARAAGTGIVPIHDFGVEGRTLYLALPLFEGGSLRALLRRGPLPWRQAAALVAKLARALERAHAVGLVHRDVKPDNVLLDEAGEPWLADFGAVRDLAASRLTETGTTIGTLAYMSPEQLDARPVDARTDVYALGVLLSEAVAGARPFDGASVVAHMAARAGPRPSLAGQGAPPELERVLDRALALEPARRTPSASALARDLEALVERAASPPGVEKPRPSRALAPGIGLAVVGAFAVLALALAWRRPPRAQDGAGAGPSASHSPAPSSARSSVLLEEAADAELGAATSEAARKAAAGYADARSALPAAATGAASATIASRTATLVRKRQLALALVAPSAQIATLGAVEPTRSENECLLSFAPHLYARGLDDRLPVNVRLALHRVAWKIDAPRARIQELAAWWRAVAVASARGDADAVIRLESLPVEQQREFAWRIAWGWRAQLVAPANDATSGWTWMAELRQVLLGAPQRDVFHQLIVEDGLPCEHPTLWLFEALWHRDRHDSDRGVAAALEGLEALPPFEKGEDAEVGRIARALVQQIAEVQRTGSPFEKRGLLERAAEHDPTGGLWSLVGGIWQAGHPDFAARCLERAKALSKAGAPETFALESDLLWRSARWAEALALLEDGYARFHESEALYERLVQHLHERKEWAKLADVKPLDRERTDEGWGKRCLAFRLEALFRVGRREAARDLARGRDFLEEKLAKLESGGR